MGAIVELLATLLAAGAMGILPSIVKFLVKLVPKEEDMTKIEIKGPSGQVQVIELKKNMSAEEIKQISQQLIEATKPEKPVP